MEKSCNTSRAQFSFGVNELNIDGTPKLDGQGATIPTYSQTTVNEFTRVFTGWNLNPTLIAPGTNNWRDPMVPRVTGTNHDTGAKTLLTERKPGSSLYRPG